MTQAIGRALRFGQKKKVHVYFFLVKYTADVDLIEFRKKSIIKCNGGEAELCEGSREESKFGSSFYEYVSREFD